MKTFPFAMLSAVLLLGSLSAGEMKPLVRCKAELDRAVLPAGQQQTAVVKITLAAENPPVKAKRAPINLCIVLDRSGSMSGDKIAQARKAALEALSRLGSQDVFSLITYDSEVKTLIPAGQLKDLGRARDLIHNIHTGGDTALFGGVSQGASELRKYLEDAPKGMVHRMLLLSDGKANVGPASADELGRLGKSLVKEGISVTTIGIGTDYNEDLMTQLAQRSDGNTYFVQESQDLVGIFNEEIGDVLNVVAREVKIIIECPGQVRPLRSIGKEARIRGQQVELKLNQLYGGQERYLLLELDVPPGEEDSVLPLLDARVEYHNMLRSRVEKQGTRLLARFSPDEQMIFDNINPIVQNDYYLNKGAEAKDEAIRLYEEGKKDEAILVLERNGLELKQAAAAYDLDELLLESGNIMSQSLRLQQEGLTPTNRKELRTEAAQEKQQQKSKLRYDKY